MEKKTKIKEINDLQLTITWFSQMANQKLCYFYIWKFSVEKNYRNAYQ